MDRIVYLIFRFFIFIFRIIPFRALYCFSDLVYLVVYYVVGYRKKVVFANLKNSFPEKSVGEINRIARGFYHHFADLAIESLKAFTMNEQAVVKRYQYTNLAFLDALYREGKSVICVAGHYGNWEWGGIATGTQMLHKPVGFYKPLSNKYVDAYIRRTRVQGRSVLASITHTAETFLTDWREPAIFYMVADQSPSSPRLAHWVNFLNQDTATLHGPEKYARMYNIPVVFACIKKVKRGNYSVGFEMLEPNPVSTKTGEITVRYMQMLEAEIKAQPEYYLWSHRRWKLTRKQTPMR
ncbi:MAG: lysophospholipid acyltransferase family protein [Bacteroidales bacterium]|jgi:KDO2-lipid IV(A) lauroyltransferase|nr:lysophospholipid acyltransferase family protein [Bacteroidales bacterium]